MFNCVKPHDSRFITYPAFTGSEFYEKGSTDDTHLNLYGADLIAQWAADIMVELGVPLAEKRSGRTAPTLPSFTQATEAPALSFQDTAPTDWFYPYVQAVCARGLFTGAGDGQFQPDTTTSRAMMATILWRMAGEPTPDYLTPFSDVETGNWYMDAVRWAKQSGVVNGYDDGSFGPDDSITREQLALMLYRFAQIQGVADDAGPDVSLSFDDGDTVSPWAVEAVRWCVAKGLLTGKPGQADDSNTFGLRFDPQGPATRAETAAVTARLALLLEDPWTFLHV